MSPRPPVVALALLLALGVGAVPAAAQVPPPPGVECVAPAGDAAPGTQAWTERDRRNQLCAVERLRDQYANPAFLTAFYGESWATDSQKWFSQLEEPDRPRVSLAQLIPGATTADPYRTLARWNNQRGRVRRVSFTASDGARLQGHVFAPLRSGVKRPAIVITTGSLQGYQHVYFWAAQGLAEAGYVVLTYDVQGQGTSETLPHPCDFSACPGVPFQQDYNFVQGTRDALDYLLSRPTSPTRRGDVNPSWREIDRAHIGLAGHSLGASAVSVVGQDDRRVSAVVGWDNLATLPASARLRTPALGINSEYFVNPQPTSTPPDRHARDGGFRQLAAAGIDTMQVALVSSTHLEYTYIPFVLPASRLGERVSFHYTLAWFDRYLKGATDRRVAADARRRLTTRRFDRSADAHSIGAGTFDPGAGVDGNAPYRIAGLKVADRLSFYYVSSYALEHGRERCADMRAGCGGRSSGLPS